MCQTPVFLPVGRRPPSPPVRGEAGDEARSSRRSGEVDLCFQAPQRRGDDTDGSRGVAQGVAHGS